jgi:hypothetical protein
MACLFMMMFPHGSSQQARVSQPWQQCRALSRAIGSAHAELSFLADARAAAVE